MMILEKKLNNNIALVVENQETLIVMGKGISFNKKPGDSIDETLIEQKFYSNLDRDDSVFDKLKNSVADLSEESIYVAIKISELVKLKLKSTMNFTAIIALADHIDFAVERFKNNMIVSSPLASEIKQFYPKELAVARKSLFIIKSVYGVDLDDDEAISITLHLINSTEDELSMSQTMDITKMSLEVLKLIEEKTGLQLDTDDMNVARFLTHLKYFFIRQSSPNEKQQNLDESMYKMVKKLYPQNLALAKDIVEQCDYIQSEHSSIEELVYLTLHLNRLIDRKTIEK